MDPIRLALVDDHHVVRRALCSFLQSFPDITIVGEAASGESALERVEDWLPDVVIMDLLMPGGIDGIETTRRIRTITPHTQVVALTAHTDDARVVGALRAGAIGYVRKDAEPEILLTAVRAAARGQSVLDPAIAGTVLQELVGGTRTGDDLTEKGARGIAPPGPRGHQPRDRRGAGDWRRDGQDSRGQHTDQAAPSPPDSGCRARPKAGPDFPGRDRSLGLTTRQASSSSATHPSPSSTNLARVGWPFASQPAIW